MRKSAHKFENAKNDKFVGINKSEVLQIKNKHQYSKYYNKLVHEILEGINAKVINDIKIGA